MITTPRDSTAGLPSSTPCLGTRKILALANDYANVTGDFPNNWAMPLGWPKPSWGAFELRGVDLVDIRRVPSERAGYCYGSRIMYVDQAYTYADWIEIYDQNLELWKSLEAAPPTSSTFRSSVGSSRMRQSQADGMYRTITQATYRPSTRPDMRRL
jgi:hypothetical protein